MHAYLFVGSNEKSVDKDINEMLSKNNLQRIDVEIKNISDVRNLNKLTKLKNQNPTAYIIKNVDETNIETLNSLLKNLEEPASNTTFVLTAKSTHSIPSTILSRCSVRNVAEGAVKIKNNIGQFIEMSTGERINYIKGIKDRDRAIKFLEEYIFYLQKNIDRDNTEQKIVNISLANQTRSAIRKYSNVFIQLANFVINIE